MSLSSGSAFTTQCNGAFNPQRDGCTASPRVGPASLSAPDMFGHSSGGFTVRHTGGYHDVDPRATNSSARLDGYFFHPISSPFGGPYSATVTDDYLHIILTDEEDMPEALGRLRVIYPNIMRLSYDNTRTRSSQVIGSAVQVKSRSPLDLFEELYQLQNNQPMSEVQRTFTQELIESIQEGRV